MHAELVCSLQISKSISTQRQEWLLFDATHSSKRYCGLDVYTVSFAWCVYEGWNNSDAWVSNVQEIGSSSFFGLLTFFCLLQYSTQTENCGFSQWVDPPAIRPYQGYIDYLEHVVIYILKRELSEALASPNPSSSAGDGRCCKRLTYTCECHKKINSLRKIDLLHLHHLHPQPPRGYYGMPSQTPATICFPGSSHSTRLIRHVVIQFLNSLRHVTST
jgi:hypothetical protein